MQPLPAVFVLVLFSVVPVADAAQCMVGTTGLRFGSMTTSAARNANAMGTLIVTCRGKVGELVRYRLRLTRGQGTFRQRVMQSRSEPLAYNLYLDAGRTRVWGDGSEGSSDLSGTLVLGAPVTTHLYVVYGRILGSAPVDSVTYTDTVAFQLEY